jgi:hypothetical protein
LSKHYKNDEKKRDKLNFSAAEPTLWMVNVDSLNAAELDINRVSYLSLAICFCGSKKAT